MLPKNLNLMLGLTAAVLLIAGGTVALAGTASPIPEVPVGNPQPITGQPLSDPEDLNDPKYPDVTNNYTRCVPAQFAPPTGDGSTRVEGTEKCGFATAASAAAWAAAYVCPAYQGFVYSPYSNSEARCVSGTPKPCIREAKSIVVPAYPLRPSGKSVSLPGEDANVPGTYCVNVYCSYTAVATPTQSQKYIVYDCKT